MRKLLIFSMLTFTAQNGFAARRPSVDELRLSEMCEMCTRLLESSKRALEMAREEAQLTRAMIAVQSEIKRLEALDPEADAEPEHSETSRR